MHRLFNRYVALAIAVQFILVALVWIIELTLEDKGSKLFDLLFWFYSPPMLIVSRLVGGYGESAMFATIIYGFVLGVFLYGFIFGFVMSLVKRGK